MKQVPQLLELTCVGVRASCNIDSSVHNNTLIRPALQSLDLIRCDLSPLALHWLFNLCASTLQELCISPFKSADFNNYLSLIGPRLKTLTLGRCSNSSNESLRMLENVAVNCPRISNLTLGRYWEAAAVQVLSVGDASGDSLTPKAGTPESQSGFALAAQRQGSRKRLFVKSVLRILCSSMVLTDLDVS